MFFATYRAGVNKLKLGVVTMRTRTQERSDPRALASTFDVALVGGGPAGSSAAVLLGPIAKVGGGSRRRAPRNRAADGVHGYLTRDGFNPQTLVETAHREVETYGGINVRETTSSARRTAGGFEVEVPDIGTVRARRPPGRLGPGRCTAERSGTAGAVRAGRRPLRLLSRFRDPRRGYRRAGDRADGRAPGSDVPAVEQRCGGLPAHGEPAFP